MAGKNPSRNRVYQVVAVASCLGLLAALFSALHIGTVEQPTQAAPPVAMLAAAIGQVPQQELNLSVATVIPTANLSFSAGSARFIPNFKGWEIANGGNTTINLKVTQASPVNFGVSAASEIFGNTKTSYLTVKVNGTTLAQDIKHTNDNYTTIWWNIPANLLKAGTNPIQISIQNSPTQAVLFNRATVVSGNFAPITSASATVPYDIPGGASNSNLTQAAYFAWQEFIALNWPAEDSGRDVPNTDVSLGYTYSGGTISNSGNTPTVWMTFRSKTEIYPGLNSNHTPTTGKPNGYVDNAGQDYGYNSRPPQYFFQPSKVGTTDGRTNSFFSQQSGNTAPWINLAEASQIFQDTIYAGLAPKSSTGSNAIDRYPEQQFLFLAKANKPEYTYVAGNKWWYKESNAPFTATANYLAQNGKIPTPGDSTYVSLPTGTIEIKSAWRQLTSAEAASGRFLIAPVRYYREKSSADETPTFIDSAATTQSFTKGSTKYEVGIWGMAALHIIQKTPSAPYYIFATFSQADNLVSASGHEIENANGTLTTVGQGVKQPLSPLVATASEASGFGVSDYYEVTLSTNTNATALDNLEGFTAKGSPVATTPDLQVYYENLAAEDNVTPHILPQAKYIGVDKSYHDIPQTITDVNGTVQNAISTYLAANGKTGPWQNYKLVNVQFVPLDKAPGVLYSGADKATYYLANEVVETDYNLQVFSGQFSSKDATMQTDYVKSGTDDVPAQNAAKFKNVQFNQFQGTDGEYGYLMGGCMGCHGVAQSAGQDMSFILRGQSVAEPEVASDDTSKHISKYKALKATK